MLSPNDRIWQVFFLDWCSWVYLMGALWLAVACTINILRLLNDASRIIIDNSRVSLQIVASLTDDSRGFIDNPRGIIYTH